MTCQALKHIECSECGESSGHPNHDDKNRFGHLFNTGPALLEGRTFEAPTQPPARKPKPPRERKMPSLVDYKWWARSFRKQRIIRDMAVNVLHVHEAALERLVVEVNPPRELRGLVVSPELQNVLQEIVEQLGNKLAIRKRVKGEENGAFVLPSPMLVIETRVERRIRVRRPTLNELQKAFEFRHRLRIRKRKAG